MLSVLSKKTSQNQNLARQETKNWQRLKMGKNTCCVGKFQKNRMLGKFKTFPMSNLPAFASGTVKFQLEIRRKSSFVVTKKLEYLSFSVHNLCDFFLRNFLTNSPNQLCFFCGDFFLLSTTNSDFYEKNLILNFEQSSYNMLYLCETHQTPLNNFLGCVTTRTIE